MKRHTYLIFVVIGFFELGLGLTPLANDWPNWRGPNWNGISSETNWFVPWPKDGPKILWKVNVGIGFSSPSIQAGRVFSMGNSNNTDIVYCIDDKTGRILWTYSYSSPLSPDLYEGGPSATPTIDGDRLYTLSKDGKLFCLKVANGDVVWGVDLIKKYHIARPRWGFAGSPVIFQNMLLLNAGGAGMALKKDSGELIWLSNTNECGYATPVVVNNKRPYMVVFSHRELIAVEIISWKILWRIPWKTAYDMNIIDPVIWDNKWFISSWDRAAMLIQVDGENVNYVWRNDEFRTHTCNVILINDLIFGFHGDAKNSKEFKCLDIKTGKLQWVAKDIPNGSVSASADGKLLIGTGDGELIIAEADPDRFKVLSRTKLSDSRFWTPPVLANGKIYCRDALGNIFCIVPLN